MKIAFCELGMRSGHDAGRELLAALYREETGEDLPTIAAGERGKPYFVNSDWHFSISHTPRHAFCALSRQEIGMDAEELGRNIDLRLADKILSPGERAQYDAAPDKRRALLTFWVLKEAQAKFTGEGLRGYPNDTNFSLNDPRVREMEGCLVAVIEEFGALARSALGSLSEGGAPAGNWHYYDCLWQSYLKRCWHAEGVTEGVSFEPTALPPTRLRRATSPRGGGKALSPQTPICCPK